MGGFAIHSLADLMPLFWSEDISISDVGAAPAGMLVFMMAVSYLIPVAGMLCVLYSSSKAASVINAALAVFTGLFCIAHMAELVNEFNPARSSLHPTAKKYFNSEASISQWIYWPQQKNFHTPKLPVNVYRTGSPPLKKDHPFRIFFMFRCIKTSVPGSMAT